MRPVTHILIDPAFEELELFQPELAFEPAGEVAHHGALFEFAASPQFLEDGVPFRHESEVSEA